MKKILTLLIITLISFSPIIGQNNLTKKADKLFDRLEFVKAADEYLKIANKDSEDYYVISQLAESYYNIFNTVEAEKWYSKIVDSSSDAEVIYKYAQMLKANGKYKESNVWMNKFADMRPYDNRSTAFKKDPNYLTKIINKGKRFNVQNLDINSEYSDFGGVLFEDNIYITSARNDKGRKYGWNNEPFLDIYKFDVDQGSYLNEQILEDVINTKYHEGMVAFSPDGETMYFTRESLFDKSYYKDSLNYNQMGVIHLYKATRCIKKHITWKDNGKCKFSHEWSNATRLEINSPNYSIKNPSLSCDGEIIYFSSDMPGGYGNFDIYKGEIDSIGNISNVKNLGQKINTEGQEMFPHVCCDNILYFSSDAHLGLGGMDVFYTKPVDGKWTAPRNVGIPVNSNADDFAFILAENCEDGFVSSNRSGGKGSDDVYAVKKLLPLCDILLTTNILDSKTKEPISFATTSISDNTGIVDNTKMTSEKGLAEFMIECEDKIQLTVSKTGYESKMLDLTFTDIPPPVLDVYLDPIEEIIVEEKINLNPIYFDFDKSNITNKAAFELDKLVAIMEKYPEMIIRAESHTDSRGPASYNKGLSDRRAKSTAQYVISKGISEDRITGVGKGEEEPRVDCSQGCSKEEHAQNRRSEFIIVSR
ncbi:MAG: cell envelope biogenesis protein OmpA [Flavobacteriales bacterium]|nr:MAG: cell envelope biogenesis protein OmpA [Flavobacteriales bacterium]